MRFRLVILISSAISLLMLALLSQAIDPRERFKPPCHEQGWRKIEGERECVRFNWSRK